MEGDDVLQHKCSATTFQKHIVPEIRLLVVASAFLQIVLGLSGNARQRSKSTILSNIIWLTYLLADSVPGHTLTLISFSQTFIQRNIYDPLDCNSQLLDALAIWSPFLLLHNGGPDTITAFSLEDNTLWWRRLDELLFNTIKISIILRRLFFDNEIYVRFCIPIFLVGFLRYFERIICLMSASFRRPRFSYSIFLSSDAAQTSFPSPPTTLNNLTPRQEKYYQIVSDAHYLSQNFNRIFVNLSVDDHNSILLGKNLLQTKYQEWKEVFKLIEIQLQLMFEELFTKPVPHRAKCRFFLKIINFQLIFTAFILFALMTGFGDLKANTITTYILLGGALLLEIYQGVPLLWNDWMIIGLMKQQEQYKFPFSNLLRIRLLKAIPSSWLDLLKEPPRWSNSMGQCNLVSICLRRPYFELPEQLESSFKKMSLLWIRDLVDQLWRRLLVPVGSKDIEDKLKEVILEHLRERVSTWEEVAVVEQQVKQLDRFRRFLNTWGKLAFEKYRYWKEEYDRGITTLEIDHSILVWHIATDICWYDHLKKDPTSTSTSNSSLSKHLSDYLFYLLFQQPIIVTSKLIPHKLIIEGCKALRKEFMKEPGLKKIMESESEACLKLYDGNNIGNDDDHPVEKEKIDWNELKKQRSSDINISVIQPARTLAKDLMRSENEEKRWEMIRDIWLEMLVYVANQCPGDIHAAQLAKGGELITHVWLLMTHLGISTPCEPVCHRLTHDQTQQEESATTSPSVMMLSRSTSQCSIDMI